MNITGLHAALLGLEKQVGRAADSHRAAELDALREQQRREQAAARRMAAQEILPALDGLDEALRSGRQLLAAAAQRAEVEPPASASPAQGGWLGSCSANRSPRSPQRGTTARKSSWPSKPPRLMPGLRA